MSKPQLQRTPSDPPPKDYVEKISLKLSAQKDKDYNDYNVTSSSLYNSTSSMDDLDVLSMSSFEQTKSKVVVNSSNAGQSEEDDEIVSVNKCKIDFSKLEFVKQIGSGAFGIVVMASSDLFTVWKAKYLGVNVAVKSVDSTTDSSDFLNEVSVLKALRHPNIVLFLGYTVSPRLCIVTEYMKNGNLSRILQDFTKHIDSQKILAIALGVARGMFYLHSQHPTIIHRDLKSGNILIDYNWNIKVADYGLSVIAHNDQQNQFLEGDAKWRAPEHIKEKNNYTIKSDVFSYAVLLWELLTRKEPYSDEGWTVTEVLKNVRVGYRLKIPSSCPQMLKELIEKCWAEDPNERPDFDGVITTLELFGKDRSFHKIRSFSEVVSLVDVENSNKDMTDNAVPQFQRAQVMTSIFQTGFAVKGVEAFMKQVLPLVVNVTNYVWLLINKEFGKFMVIFVYPQGSSSVDSDKVALRHKDLAAEYAKMFCTPIVRESMVLLELVDFDALAAAPPPATEATDSGKEEDKTTTPKLTPLKHSNEKAPLKNSGSQTFLKHSANKDKSNPDYNALHRVNYLSGEEEVLNVLNNALRKSEHTINDNLEEAQDPPKTPKVDEEFLRSLPTLPSQSELPQDTFVMTLTLRETEFNNAAHKNLDAFKNVIPLLKGTGIKKLMLLNAPSVHKVIFLSRWESEAALKRAVTGGLLHAMFTVFKDKINSMPSLESFHFVPAPHSEPQ